MAYARILFSFFLSAALSTLPWSLHETPILWSVQTQYRMIWSLWMGLLYEILLQHSREEKPSKWVKDEI